MTNSIVQKNKEEVVFLYGRIDREPLEMEAVGKGKKNVLRKRGPVPNFPDILLRGMAVGIAKHRYLSPDSEP